jgi:hypothetical protein
MTTDLELFCAHFLQQLKYRRPTFTTIYSFGNLILYCLLGTIWSYYPFLYKPHFLISLLFGIQFLYWPSFLGTLFSVPFT